MSRSWASSAANSTKRGALDCQPKSAGKTRLVDSAVRPGRRLRLFGSWRPLPLWRPPQLLDGLVSVPVLAAAAILGFEPSPLM